MRKVTIVLHFAPSNVKIHKSYICYVALCVFTEIQDKHLCNSKVQFLRVFLLICLNGCRILDALASLKSLAIAQNLRILG